MQMNEANKLNNEWGDKPCDHPQLEKEYHFGSDTGDYVCVKCGQSGFGRDWAKKEKKS